MASKSLERSPPNIDAALAFIRELFGNGLTESNVYFSSLANNDAPANEPGERRLATRDPEKLANFIGTWDKQDRGLYFAVGTVSDRRTKDGIVETIGLHADIDFKGVAYSSYEDIFATIGHLLCRPTAVVRSGHGVHLYWLLHKAIPAQENRDRVEELLKLVANVVAGDMQVCEISRLMRLPGTHNTKFNSWVAVECVYSDGPRYELQELGDWLGDWSSPRQRPILHRRVGSVGHGSPDAPTISASPATAAAALSDNPFIRMAQEHGVKLPIDVDARLAAMTHHGDGDTGVHATQVQVSAALLERGAAVDEVVERILTATQAVAGTGNWDWRKERRDLHSMCLTWLSKRSKDQPALDQGPPDELAQEPTPNPGPDGFTKATKSPKPLPGKPKTKEAHVVIAKGILAALEERGEQIMSTISDIYWYTDHLWLLQDDKQFARRIDRETTVGARALGLVTTAKLAHEVRAWIMREPEIFLPDVKLNAHGKIPVINGLIDARSGTLEPPRPQHYATWRIEHPYDPAATCPVFLDMLDAVFGDRDPEPRAKIIELFFELLGVGLIDNKSKGLSRALVLEGGADTGKTQLLRVIGGLFGGAISTPIAQLEDNHGTSDFEARLPWILDEAADEGDWHKSSTVKQLISGDPIRINPKNRKSFTAPFTAPIFWGTNHLPHFKEITRAIGERLALVQCRQTFNKRKPIRAAKLAEERGYGEPSQLVIATEMSGVLAMAVAGLKRALARNHFEIPQESLDLMEELYAASNVAVGFRNLCLRYNPGKMMSRANAYAMFSGYYAFEHGIDAIPTQTRFSLAMSGLGDSRIVTDPKLRRSNGSRYYGCVEPTEYGLARLKDALDSEHFSLGAKKFLGADITEPSLPLLDSWGADFRVRQARKLWEAEQKQDVSDAVSPVIAPEQNDGFSSTATGFEKTRHTESSRGSKRTRF